MIPWSIRELLETAQKEFIAYPFLSAFFKLHNFYGGGFKPISATFGLSEFMTNLYTVFT